LRPFEGANAVIGGLVVDLLSRTVADTHVDMLIRNCVGLNSSQQRVQTKQPPSVANVSNSCKCVYRVINEHFPPERASSSYFSCQHWRILCVTQFGVPRQLLRCNPTMQRGELRSGGYCATTSSNPSRWCADTPMSVGKIHSVSSPIRSGLPFRNRKTVQSWRSPGPAHKPPMHVQKAVSF
jgi:hypothetical protein